MTATMIACTAQLNLSPQYDTSFRDRESFLETLWASYQCAQILENTEAAASSRPYPKRYTNTQEQFFAAALPLSERYHAETIAGGSTARDAVLMFLYGMRRFMGRADDNQLPREWLALFERAHLAGELCVMAWGAAVRAIYTSCGPTPHDMGRNHGRYLDLMRSVPRAAMMADAELARYEALPEVVTLYRGSVTPTDAQGISWTLDKAGARYFAGVRESVARGMVGGRGLEQMGTTRVVAAEVPKEVILGCVSLFLDGEEFLVDWERIKPEMLRSLAYERAPGQADVIAKMLGDIRGRMLRA